MKHKHYDLIIEWAADQERVIQLLDSLGNWIDVTNPSWRPELEFRFKPKAPKFITVNGFLVPEPVREPLVDGQDYWVAETDLGWAIDSTWDMCELDFRRLHLGIVHLVESKAQAHIDAMLAPSRSDK